MGTTVLVRDHAGNQLLQGTVRMQVLVEAARELALPFLSSVDEYDDTTFNRLQTTVIVDELRQVPMETSKLLAEAGAEVRAAIALVQERPHRYLVFNGD